MPRFQPTTLFLAVLILTALAPSSVAKDKINGEALLRNSTQLMDIWSTTPAGGALKLQADISFHTPSGDKKGKFLLLWISTSSWRYDLTTPDFSESYLKNQGKTSQLQNPKQAPDYVWNFQRAISAVLHKTDAAQLNYTLVENASYPAKSEAIGNTNLSCVYISAGPKLVERGCFDPASGLLQFVNEGNKADVFSDYAPFGGKTFPRHMRVFIDQTVVADAELKLEVLDKIDETAMAAPAGAEEKEVSTKKCSDPAIPPRVLRQVKPDYPTGVSRGTVSVLAVIDETGKVIRTEVVHSLSPAQDSAALNALGQWQFSPATKCGNPIQTETTLNFDF